MVVNIVDHLTNTASIKVLETRRLLSRLLSLMVWCERMNMTWMQRVRCLLSEAKLPNSFWGEALLTAAHVINLSPTVALQSDVPNSVWHGKDVSLTI